MLNGFKDFISRGNVVDLAVAVVIVPLERIKERRGETEPGIKECPECLSEIPAAATRCMFCTVQQPA